jgi:hypothetical protein
MCSISYSRLKVLPFFLRRAPGWINPAGTPVYGGFFVRGNVSHLFDQRPLSGRSYSVTVKLRDLRGENSSIYPPIPHKYPYFSP